MAYLLSIFYLTLIYLLVVRNEKYYRYIPDIPAFQVLAFQALTFQALAFQALDFQVLAFQALAFQALAFQAFQATDLHAYLTYL